MFVEEERTRQEERKEGNERAEKVKFCSIASFKIHILSPKLIQLL